MHGGSDANRSLKFQLETDVLVYAYQWAVAGSVYFQVLSAGNGGWYAGTELHHRAGAKDPKELAYEGCFFGPPQ